MSADEPRGSHLSTEQAVIDGLAPALAAVGVDLEDVRITKAGRRDLVRIVIDRDGGVDLDTVAEVSRLASDLLDADPLAKHLPGPFVLEVTSPGVDRPLTEPRHWRRAAGRLVEIRPTDGSVVVGRVSSVPSDDSVLVVVDGDEREIALADVSKAVVQVEFTPDTATQTNVEGDEE